MIESYEIYIEIAIISLLMLLVVVLVIVVVTVGIITWLRKYNTKSGEDYQQFDIKNKNAKKFRGIENKGRSIEEGPSLPFDDDGPCTVKYKIAHSPFVPNEKLSIKLESMIIGGSNNSIKSNFFDFHQIYFRILLNNISTNSIIVSDKYPFKNHIVINETFIFQLKKQFLENTSFVVETFANFKNRNDEFFIGWVEVELPENFTSLPLDKTSHLETPNRVIDLYFKSIGYVCVSLLCSGDEIKVGILATTYLDPGINVMNLENFKLYFTVKSKNSNSTFPLEKGSSTYEWFKPTIIWNKIFNFKYLIDSKSEQSISISLWKINSMISDTTEKPVKIGTVKFGFGPSYNKKSEDHWESVFNNVNKEIVKWHPINMNNKDFENKSEY